MPAKSVAQRRLMAMALKVKKGEIKYKDASPEVQRLSKTMSAQQLEDYAKTKEKNLPKKKNESIKEEHSNELLIGGMADNKTLEDIARKHNVDIKEIESEFKMGLDVEKEHTDNSDIAEEIAKDHLWEMPNYYTKLKGMEAEDKNEEAMVTPGAINGMGPVALPNGQMVGSGDIPFMYGSKKKEDEDGKDDEKEETKESFSRFKYISSYKNFKNK